MKAGNSITEPAMSWMEAWNGFPPFMSFQRLDGCCLNVIMKFSYCVCKHDLLESAQFTAFDISVGPFPFTFDKLCCSLNREKGWTGTSIILFFSAFALTTRQFSFSFYCQHLWNIAKVLSLKSKHFCALFLFHSTTNRKKRNKKLLIKRWQNKEQDIKLSR